MTEKVIDIRKETEADYAAVGALLDRSFGQPDEARLVTSLRQCSAFIPELSLVAELDGRIVGHIMFTKVSIVRETSEYPSLALAPMAVRPNSQRNGIGTKLVRTGLQRAGELGHQSVIVLGHPDYYPRFGFIPASYWNIEPPIELPDSVFMALELIPGGLKHVQGVVRYSEPFGI